MLIIFCVIDTNHFFIVPEVSNYANHGKCPNYGSWVCSESPDHSFRSTDLILLPRPSEEYPYRVGVFWGNVYESSRVGNLCAPAAKLVTHFWADAERRARCTLTLVTTQPSSLRRTGYGALLRFDGCEQADMDFV